ncbi:universal stress protein [Haloferax sp. YSMS24]|uniref:universal stress protein n=1 Tax=unclassified Haloferax TaxID=2625095 RepID=UPI00398D288C
MYETILVPVDGSAPSELAVEQATNLAKTLGATVHVLYVVDERVLHATQLDAGGLVRAYEEEGEKIVSEEAEVAQAADVDVVTAVEHGSPHRAILRYADEHDVDLIVMGTHGRRGLERYLIGSVTERVLRMTDVPILTIRGKHEPIESR